ncbi:MAG: hypothetical protein U1A78_18360 [Polyangia bacterium]
MSFWDRYASHPPRRTVVDEIVDNLQAALNARRGFSSAQPDFGLSSIFAKQGSRDMILALRDEILDLVQREEPRLVEPELDVLGRDGKQQLLLELRGGVDGKPQRLRIGFDTMLFEVHVEALK